MLKNKIYLSSLLMAIFVLSFTSCEIEEVENPNGPTTAVILNGASLADLQLLVSGLESVMRNDLSFHYNTVSIVGREYYDLSGTDPRYTGELLGAQGAQLDPNGFLTTRAFAQVYRVARNANNLITAVANSEANLTDAQKNGLVGIAETLKAYSLLLELNRQFNNGIRIDVNDPENLGPFLGYDASLDALEDLLNDADDKLNSAGDEFVVVLSSGFDGFNTPSSFSEFNRAICARVNLYQNDNAGLMDCLNNSFMDMNGNMRTGVYHIFGVSGNDIPNSLQVVPDQDFFTAQNEWVTEMENGDARMSKVRRLLDEDGNEITAELDGLEGDWQINLYPSNTTPVPMVRNEELILMYAEANLNNLGDYLMAINSVRNAASLPDYTGDTGSAALTSELLNQRRYSLFGEGHRWIDLRRFNRIGDIQLDRSGDVVHGEFPRPVAEVN